MATVLHPVCWLARRRLSAFRDGELAPADRRRVQAHLACCPGCAADLASLDRLRALLAGRRAGPEGPESSVPDAIWAAFWPQVRERLAVPPAPEPWWRRAWAGAAGHPGLSLGSALAAGAVVVLAFLAPWQSPPGPPAPPHPATPVISAPPGTGAPTEVVVHSVETADPQSSVMVFANPESDVTVVWVFGLPRTDI